MPPTPCHELGHVVVSDLGNDLVLAEKFDQQREPVLGGIGTREMLPDFVPVAFGHVIEP